MADTINDNLKESPITIQLKTFDNHAFKVDDEHGNHKKANDSFGVVDDKKMLDFDDMLPLIGEFGRYQKLLFLLMIPFSFFLVFVYFTQIFITLVPEQHWCRIPELENLTATERYV